MSMELFVFRISVHLRLQVSILDRQSKKIKASLNSWLNYLQYIVIILVITKMIYVCCLLFTALYPLLSGNSWYKLVK